MDFSIDPLHADILSSYRAIVHGTDTQGVTDIEFQTMHHATAWATEELPCCVWGAARVLGFHGDEWFNVLLPELPKLYNQVSEWNDNSTQAEVLAKLREVADKYDAQLTD